MKQYINTTEYVKYNGKQITVHWIRNAYKKKSDLGLFPENEGIITVEKDLITFRYNGIEIQDSYETDEYSLEGRIWDICNVIDTKDFDELTKMVNKWRKL